MPVRAMIRTDAVQFQASTRHSITLPATVSGCHVQDSTGRGDSVRRWVSSAVAARTASRAMGSRTSKGQDLGKAFRGRPAIICAVTALRRAIRRNTASTTPPRLRINAGPRG